jgi:hypothetical protein
MKKILFLILILMPGLNGLAQTIYKNQVRVENQSITRTDDNRLTIAMDVILQKNFKMTSNNSAILTPILEKDGKEQKLPAILVYGRRREIYDLRNNKTPKGAFTTIRRKSNTEQTIKYLTQLPFETWMGKSNLVMNCDLCGCCDAVKGNTLDPITGLNILREKPHTNVTFVSPKPEPVKIRSLVGRAFLDFPVNKTTIYPNYRKNQSELAKIRATIDTVRNDKNVNITGITVAGYASPEGPYKNNERLARERTAALVKYVQDYYSFNKNLMHSSYTPEDWDGFRKMIDSSDIAQKDKVLEYIDQNDPNMDAKEWRIRKYVGVDTYKYILNNIYVALRHTDYTITYNVRGFNNEETREVIKKHPQQLSLQEIYNLAQTYKEGSEEYNECFRVAVAMFPDDPTANLNAAAMEIEKGGDLTLAKKYLSKADPNSAATQNNLGVVDMLDGNYATAESHFNKAKMLGLTNIANANLKELQKQRSFPSEDETSMLVR